MFGLIKRPMYFLCQLLIVDFYFEKSRRLLYCIFLCNEEFLFWKSKPPMRKWRWRFSFVKVASISRYHTGSCARAVSIYVFIRWKYQERIISGWKRQIKLISNQIYVLLQLFCVLFERNYALFSKTILLIWKISDRMSVFGSPALHDSAYCRHSCSKLIWRCCLRWQTTLQLPKLAENAVLHHWRKYALMRSSQTCFILANSFALAQANIS